MLPELMPPQNRINQAKQCHADTVTASPASLQTRACSDSHAGLETSLNATPFGQDGVTPLSMRRQIRALDFVFAFFALCGALKSNCPAYRPARGQVMLVIECTGIAAQRAD